MIFKSWISIIDFQRYTTISNLDFLNVQVEFSYWWVGSKVNITMVSSWWQIASRIGYYMVYVMVWYALSTFTKVLLKIDCNEIIQNLVTSVYKLSIIKNKKNSEKKYSCSQSQYKNNQKWIINVHMRITFWAGSVLLVSGHGILNEVLWTKLIRRHLYFSRLQNINIKQKSEILASH